MLRFAHLLVFAGLALSPFVMALFDSTPSSTADAFFFARQEASLLAFGLTAFLAWNRRERIRSLPPLEPSGADLLLALMLGAGGVTLCIWSRLVTALDLYAFSLLVLALTVCVCRKGARSLGRLRMPMFVALLVLPLPAPLYNEVVWLAQRLATDGASWMLSALGQDIYSASMLISLGQYDFWVIETCSGLRSVELLTLISILVLDLSPVRKRADRLLIPLAGCLALVLNMVRIVAVALYSSAANEVDHVTQGLVAVIAGTLILYGLQRAGFPWLDRGREASQGVSDLAATAAISVEESSLPVSYWAPPAAFVAVVVLLVPSWPVDRSVAAPVSGLPEMHLGWVSEDLESTRQFFNSLPVGRSLHRRYERPQSGDRRPERVDVYVAEKSRGHVRSSLTSSKFGWLGPDWEAVPDSQGHVWQISREGVWSLAHRGQEGALALVWQTGARARWSEALATTLAFDRVPMHKPALPRVFRLSTPIRGALNEARALENAERTILGFLGDFAAPLEGMAARASVATFAREEKDVDP
jgi:exosortase